MQTMYIVLWLSVNFMVLVEVFFAAMGATMCKCEAVCMLSKLL